MFKLENLDRVESGKVGYISQRIMGLRSSLLEVYTIYKIISI